MNSTRTSVAAEIRMPPWLWGNDILGYAKTAQLKLHAVDAADYRWRVEALERHERRPAPLVELVEVAPPGAPARWELLAGLPLSRVPNIVRPEHVAMKRRQLVEETAADDVMARLNWLHMSLTLAPDDQFIDAARNGFDSLRASTADGGHPFFPDLAGYFVRFDKALTWRAGLARLMVRIEEEPDLLTSRPQPGSRLTFGSATMLHTDLELTRDAYLTPLFLCHSPYIWAIIGQRQQGVMVYSLGRPLRGQAGDPAELLQQFMPTGPGKFADCPPFTAAQIAASLSWWVEHLDELLSVVTDPSTYIDRSGRYSPRRQFEAQLSLEQAGRRIQGVLVHQRDTATRRLLAFAALDTLDGLGLGSLDKAVELTRAERVLQRLEGLLPPDVAAVLLPSARRAVSALRECQAGFLANTYVSGGGVTVPGKDGGSRVVSVEAATAQYLRVLRNANHGFGGQDDKNRRRDEVLLMSHTGEVSDDLALLPYLYWLQALADPQVLRKTLAPRQ